jgi:uncharacterized protein (TIGR02147 family)
VTGEIGDMFNVFNYTDYRKFLKDFYDKEKSRNKKFTYRYLSQKVGFKSAGHFTQILQGKANISITLIERFARIIKLKKKESEYFRFMVLYNQAKRHEDKKYYFEKMASFKEAAIKIVDVKQYEFYDKWYYSAVREALDFFSFDGSNLEELGKLIVPPLSVAEVKKSMELLEELQLIQKDAQGYYRKTDAVISTGYEAQALALSNFAINTMELAKQAIDRFPKKERNLSWMTINVSEEGFEAIQEGLRTFRRNALEIAKKDKKANRVYQFNFQVYPLSRPYKKG